MSNSKWADYDVARHSVLMRINDLFNTLRLEESKAPQDQAKIDAMHAEIDALELKFDLMSPDDFSG